MSRLWPFLLVAGLVVASVAVGILVGVAGRGVGS